MIFNKFLQSKEQIYYLAQPEKCSDYKLIVLLRIRNESLILKNTLDHLSEFCDGIVAYDDCSTDNTFEILQEHPKILAIIKNFYWKKTIKGRQKAETAHRKKLMEIALKYNPTWLFCADADERYIGNIRNFITSDQSNGIDGVRLSLFDAYLTPADNLEYRSGDLKNFRKYFGVERRDILMLWRSSSNATYKGLDRREPQFKSENIQTLFYAQHYGKALSIQHWEETCDYYVNYFPYKTYGKKWEGRKGKAIHLLSDFGTPLYTWGDKLFNNSVCIHPYKETV